MEKPIEDTNVGFRMLTKLGWRVGTCLGNVSDGIVEPIRLAETFGSVSN